MATETEEKRSELKTLLDGLVEKYENTLRDNPEYRKELEGLKRTVLIDAGEEKYHFTLENGELKDYGEGDLEGADITISAPPEVFIALIKGELSPMRAMAKKMVHIKASLSDLLRFRKFFG